MKVLFLCDACIHVAIAVIVVVACERTSGSVAASVDMYIRRGNR